jgi:hypothetical protein
MKKIFDLIRIFVWIAAGAMAISTLLSNGIDELLIDYKGVVSDVKIVGVDSNVQCGTRKHRKTCNRFRLAVEDKIITHSSDDSMITDTKITYLKNNPYIYRLGLPNKDPIQSLVTKANDWFIILISILGGFTLATGTISLREFISSKASRLIFIICSWAPGIYIGINLKKFFS